MNKLLIIFTHNRPSILNKCLSTLFDNGEIWDEIMIFDDASKAHVAESIFSNIILSNQHVEETNFVFTHFNHNQGYGVMAERALEYAMWRKPKYMVWVEQDYIFKPDCFETVFNLFDTDYGQNCAGMSGYDNPDFYKPVSINDTFPRITIEDCGEDNLNREIMYKPFDLELPNKKIQLEFVSNSCGTMYFNWEMVMNIALDFPDEFDLWTQKVTDQGKPKRNLNDGMMSHGLSWLWNKYAEKHMISRNKYAALLNIKPSVANHINGGSSVEGSVDYTINGGLVPECQTFVGSPTWEEAE